ncbi:MAG: Holliday junction resolvase RuvX [Deltaproteobacteria bacterium]|nr:Holliday junction resolvase RuvX [Deltaproteobacteria bacterium]
MRFLALDYGSRRIGRAHCDAFEIVVTPDEPLERVGREKDLAALARYIEEGEFEGVVVGVPFGRDGEIGKAAANVLEFVEALRARVRVPVLTWDERFSTVAAAERLRVAAPNSARFKRERKRRIDGAAAAVILEEFLSARKK